MCYSSKFTYVSISLLCFSSWGLPLHISWIFFDCLLFQPHFLQLFYFIYHVLILLIVSCFFLMPLFTFSFKTIPPWTCPSLVLIYNIILTFSLSFLSCQILFHGLLFCCCLFLCLGFKFMTQGCFYTLKCSFENIWFSLQGCGTVFFSSCLLLLSDVRDFHQLNHMGPYFLFSF